MAEPIRFNIGTDDYIAFIRRIRDWAKDPNRFSHGRPVLPYPPPNMQQAQYADLELRAKDSNNVERTMVAKIRRHDLYIIGYRMHGAANFLEFKWDDAGKIRYIPGSTSLGFGENYSNLGGGLDMQPTVGYKTLKEAILTLSTTTNVQTRKLQVRALAVMIPEVVRFEKMSEVLTTPMKNKQDTTFQTWMAKLLHSWTPLSDMLLREDQFAVYFRLPTKPDGSPNDLSKYPELNIVTAANAAERVAILKGNYPTLSAFAFVVSPSINANSVEHKANTSNVQGKGIAMVEVFSVRVTNIAGKNPGSLYGNIELFDGLGSFPLYNLQRDKSESIRPNDIAGLTGPYRGLSGSQFFQVNVDLKNKGSSTSSDDEVSKGSLAWDLCELTNNNYYDKRLTSIVTGKSGSVTIYYTPFSNAIQARVEVMLVDGGGQNPVDIQGSLFAQYSNYSYSTDEEKKYYRTAVFSKPASKVNVGSKIPLSRTVVAVPTAGSLIIEANMTSVNNREIAKGTANFQPQMSGPPIAKEITGKNGRIRVTVTWSAQISE